MQINQRILLYLVLIAVAIFSLLPLFWMLSAAFMADGEAAVYPPRFLPQNPTFYQFEQLFDRLNVGRYFFNSLFLSITVTLFSLFFNSMAGFAFAKYRFKGKDALFNILLSSMIIPSQVTMLPLFLMMKSMGIINSYWAIIIPGLANIFGIFLIRQYALSIPDSLLEAARIDGAGDFQIYRIVILPLCMPILVTLALFTFMGTWNDFLWPLIVFTDDKMYTLPVALANLLGEHANNPELMMAGALFTLLPIIVVFLVFQKFYIRGIMLSGVKE